MKKILLIIISLTCLNLIAISQPIVYSWAKSMGGKATYDGSVGIAKDASGNVYVTGEFSGTRDFGSYSLTSLGFSDVFIAKYSSTGTCLWAVRGGASFSSAYAGKIVVNGSDLFVTGNFTNIIDFNGQAVSSYGSKDIFVTGIDQSTGNCIWIDKAGSTFDDISYGMEPQVGGGFLICGTFTGNATFGTQTVSSSSMIDFDIFLAGYSATGTCNFVKGIGSTGTDKAFAMKELPSGNMLVTGSYEGTVTFGPGYTFTSSGFSDFFLAKFSATGTLQWAFSGGGANNDVGYGVGVDAVGNIITTGFIADTATFGSINVNNPGNIEVCTIKFTQPGYPVWVRLGGNINDDIGFDIAVDAGGSSYVTGFINGNAMFGTTPVNGVSANDVFVVKYDPAGTLKWITKIGGLNFDRGKAILLDVNGFCYVAGDFADNAVFGSTGLYTDPGVSGIFLTHMGGGTLGVNEMKTAPFSMYPNPAPDFIYLDLEQITDHAFSVSIVSMDGKVVQSKLLSQADAKKGYKLEFGNINSGNYQVKLETSKGDFSKSLIVNR